MSLIVPPMTEKFIPSLAKITVPCEDDFAIGICRDKVNLRLKIVEKYRDTKNGVFALDIGFCGDKRVVAVNFPFVESEIQALESSANIAENNGQKVKNSVYNEHGWQYLREILANESPETAHICSLASHLAWWRSVYKFCPTCGTPLKESETERCLVCTRCAQSFYPPISPVIIVSIIKDGKILLAHNAKFPKDRYSLISGFVEAAENLENAAHREVFEEVGIRIKNLRYLESENWNFPNSLMTAFTAEWESGEITPDGKEITDAEWFSPNAPLPGLPPKGSVARRMIEEFLSLAANGSCAVRDNAAQTCYFRKLHIVSDNEKPPLLYPHIRCG